LEQDEDLRIRGYFSSCVPENPDFLKILFHQALRSLDIRSIIRVRLLEGHINEQALKVIWNFQPKKAKHRLLILF
jgi:hypothetical protein